MYVIVWEFSVKATFEEEFEKTYGPDGEWAEFFKRGNGYIKTELLRDLKNYHHYFTMDYWISHLAYETFRNEWKSEYEHLDRRCESLTDHEEEAGSFQLLGSPDSLAHQEISSKSGG